MNDDRLNDIAAEIERQNAAYAEFEQHLSTLDDAELRVPTAILEELDSLALACGGVSSPSVFINGVRA